MDLTLFARRAGIQGNLIYRQGGRIMFAQLSDSSPHTEIQSGVCAEARSQLRSSPSLSRPGLDRSDR